LNELAHGIHQNNSHVLDY